ncbi:MAG TPA: hypothetical protein VGL86_10405 [Polyangia bacterium]|jgi:hypothetical protein
MEEIPAVAQSTPLDQIRSLLQRADDSLSRQAQMNRTPKQRDDDFDDALRAHRQAVAILDSLRSQPLVDDELVAAIAPLQVEVADLEILISEIRFDECERTERLPRLRHVGG